MSPSCMLCSSTYFPTFLSSILKLSLSNNCLKAGSPFFDYRKIVETTALQRFSCRLLNRWPFMCQLFLDLLYQKLVNNASPAGRLPLSNIICCAQVWAEHMRISTGLLSQYMQPRPVELPNGPILLCHPEVQQGPGRKAAASGLLVVGSPAAG